MHNIPKTIQELQDEVLISKMEHSPVNDDENVWSTRVMTNETIFILYSMNASNFAFHQYLFLDPNAVCNSHIPVLR